MYFDFGLPVGTLHNIPKSEKMRKEICYRGMLLYISIPIYRFGTSFFQSALLILLSSRRCFTQLAVDHKCIRCLNKHEIGWVSDNSMYEYNPYSSRDRTDTTLFCIQYALVRFKWFAFPQYTHLLFNCILYLISYALITFYIPRMVYRDWCYSIWLHYILFDMS